MSDPYAATFRAGKKDGEAIGNQQAIIREGIIMANTANELVNAGDTHGANILRVFASKMIERAQERRDGETTTTNPKEKTDGTS